jgi:hypothetical protein
VGEVPKVREQSGIIRDESVLLLKSKHLTQATNPMQSVLSFSVKGRQFSQAEKRQKSEKTKSRQNSKAEISTGCEGDPLPLSRQITVCHVRLLHPSRTDFFP